MRQLGTDFNSVTWKSERTQKDVTLGRGFRGLSTRVRDPGRGAAPRGEHCALEVGAGRDGISRHQTKPVWCRLKVSRIRGSGPGSRVPRAFFS